MGFFFEFIRVLLPVVLAIGAAFLLIRLYIVNKLGQIQSAEEIRISLPLRLTAYERMTLFLERIRPRYLLKQVNLEGQSAAALQQHLIAQIREEFAHNLAQQVYISHDLWQKIQGTMEETIVGVNHQIQTLPQSQDEGSARALGLALLQQEANADYDSIEYVLKVLKEEAQKYMGG